MFFDCYSLGPSYSLNSIKVSKIWNNKLGTEKNFKKWAFHFYTLGGKIDIQHCCTIPMLPLSGKKRLLGKPWFKFLSLEGHSHYWSIAMFIGSIFGCLQRQRPKRRKTLTDKNFKKITLEFSEVWGTCHNWTFGCIWTT